MPDAAIGLGSNLGDRERNLREAAAHLIGLGKVLAVSSFYDTAPVGYLHQPRFLNAALLLATELPPRELMQGLLAIEQSMGRDRRAFPAKGPRVIDLDLLLYAGEILNAPELTLPHPALRERRFVLEPLAEIAPRWVDPVSGRSVAEMLNALPRSLASEAASSRP